MKHAWLLGLCLASPGFAADGPPNENLLNKFEARVFKDSSGKSIPYRLFKPRPDDPARKYPLVLFLHGAAGIGADNKNQFAGGNQVPAEVLTREENLGKHPCFILAPQCPRTDSWTGYFNQPTDAMRSSLAALKAVQKEFNIDAQRLYVVGLSMGGSGVWDLIAREPGLFAAAVPICGAGNPAKAPLYAPQHIWCFHGDKDPLVDVSYARKMIAAIKKAGGHPRYTEYPGVGHNSYVNAFNEPELLPWLFSQKLNEVPSRAGLAPPK
jgi:predicted peptidase